MADITEKDLFDGMTRAIHAAFPTAHIYSEDVEQNLTDGDFTCALLSTTRTVTPMGGERLQILCNVTCYPADGQDGCLAVSPLLSRALAEIQLINGQEIYGLDVQTSITDGVLQASVRYRADVRAAEETNPMQEFNIGGL